MSTEEELALINNSEKYSRIQIWLLAARPKTLPAAAAPVLVGSAVAYYVDAFLFGPALAALVAALLLQIGANLANDVFDYHRGADTTERLGPMRVTQAGLLSPRQVLWATWIVFGLATILGVYLFSIAGWPVVIIGVASILAAIAYTGGPIPLGYYGFGDITVFLFFGPIAVCGTFYVQAGTVSELSLWSSLPIGFLITAILVVNNLRDIDSDRNVGKLTLAVRLGANRTRWEYFLLLVSAYLIILPVLFWQKSPLWVLFSWLSLPLAVFLIRQVWFEKGKALNRTLGQTGQLTLLYALLYSVGLVLGIVVIG